MPMCWESPGPISDDVAKVCVIALQAIAEREITDENYERFCEAIEDTGVLIVDGTNIRDAGQDVKDYLFDTFYRDLVGFTYWRS